MISTGFVWTLLISGKKLTRTKVSVIYSIAVIFACGSYFNGFITETYNSSKHEIIFLGDTGWGIIIYGIFYTTVSLLILLTLYKSINRTKDTENKRRLKNIFIGALITLAVTAFTSTILPGLYSMFLFSSLDSIGFLIFLLFIAYSITRHHLFNIRVIAIEVVTFGLWATLLVRILLATTRQEILTEAGLLAISIIFGILLIRSTLNEIKQQEHIEKLSDELRKAYAHQIENSAHTNVVGPTEHVAGPRGN
jgi:uncharacterized membrane protein